MTGAEDDYAAMHAYLQLAEMEIDEVINGRLAHKRASDPEIRPLYDRGSIPTSNITTVLHNKEVGRDGATTKPPTGHRRGNRIISKRNEGLDRRQVPTNSGLLSEVRRLDDSNISRIQTAGTDGKASQAADMAGRLVVTHDTGRTGRLVTHGSDKDGRLGSNTADNDRRLVTQGSDKNGRLVTQGSDKDGRLVSQIANRDRRLVTQGSVKDGRLVTQGSDKDGRLVTQGFDKGGRFGPHGSDKDGRFVSQTADKDRRLVLQGGDREGHLVSDDDLQIGEEEDLFVRDETDDRDVLLERILHKEGKMDPPHGHISKKKECAQSRDNNVHYSVPVSTKNNRPPTDLHKLLISDRYSLLLGSGLNFLNIDDVLMTDGRDIHSSLPSVHRCHDARLQHFSPQCHHDCMDAGENGLQLRRNKQLAASFSSLPIWPNHQEPQKCWIKNQLSSQRSLPNCEIEHGPTLCCANSQSLLTQRHLKCCSNAQNPGGCWVSDNLPHQLSLSSNQYQCPQRLSLARSNSERDVHYEIGQRRRAEMLTMICEDVKRVHRPLFPEQPRYHRPIKLSPAPSSPPIPPSHLSLRHDTLPSPEPISCNLEINERDIDPDLSSSDRSGTDSELRDIFNPPPKTFASSSQSRKSYPSNDNLIISPPPGFNSPKSEEELWVKVRLVTRSQEDLSPKPREKLSTAETDSSTLASTVRHHTVPFQLEPTPELTYSIPEPADDLYLPDLSPPEETLHFPDVFECQPRTPKVNSCKASISKSSENEPVQLSVPRITQLKSTCGEVSNYEDHDLQDTQHDLDKVTRVLEDESSTNFLKSIENEKHLIQSGTDLLDGDFGELPSTNGDWSSSDVEGHGYSLAEMKSRFSKTAKDRRRLNYSNGDGACSGNHVKSIGLPSRGDKPESGDSPANNSKNDLLCDRLLSVNSEDSNNNCYHSGGSTNLFSMCLARDCKQLTSRRSPKSRESPSKTQPSCQPTTQDHEEATTQQLTSRRSPKPRESPSKTRPSCQPTIQDHEDATKPQLTEPKSVEDDCSKKQQSSKFHNSVTPDSVEENMKPRILRDLNYDPSISLHLAASPPTEHHVKFAHTEEDKGCTNTHLASSLCGGLNSRDTPCCRHMLERAVMKDSAVQTSLEGDAVDGGGSDNMASQVGASRSELGSNLEDTLTNRSIEQNDSLQGGIQFAKKESQNVSDNIRLDKNNSMDLNSNNTLKIENIEPSVELRTVKLRKLPKASFLRSKSVHGSAVEGSDAKGSRSYRPESPHLTVNLRELSHLNIDVSQRLVDGEERYVVDNGSPELQMVVNALTPVLSRRNRARNARRLQSASPVKDISGASTQTARETEPTSTPVDQQNTVAAELQSLDSCLKILEYGEANDEGDNLPLYTRLKSHEGTGSERRNIDPNSPKEIVSKHLNKFNGGKSDCQKSDNLAKKQILANATPRTSSVTKEAELPGFNSKAEYDLDLSVGRDDLDQELEKSRKSLFLSPNLAHTWHGASSSSTHRSAPKVKVGPVPGEEAKLVDEPAEMSLPLSEKPTADYNQNSYTMPVISRTLLDALHKRYCSHQYSGHYQSLQPFSLLKLDSTFSSGNPSATALLVEPRRAIDHEVHAAPPSPEVIARFRMLTAKLQPKSDKDDKDDTQTVIQSVSQEHSTDPRRDPQDSEESTAPQQTSSHCQDQFEVPRTIPEETSQESSQTATPNSTPSPSPRDKLNHGSKHHGELEALEALKWLRAAGFPQYAQMFDDGQFPVDIGVVERDHDFLDKDSLQSLFRRLDTLNKCAGIRLDALPSKKATSEEEDEDDFCALSERWEYQKSARRWNRKDLTPSQKAAAKERSSRGLTVRSGSHDSLLADQDSESQTGDSPLFEPKMPHQLVVQHHGMASLSHGGHAVAEISTEEQKGSPISPHLRRAASERIKTAKSLFKKMDGLKTSKSRRQTSNKNIMEISGPVLADRENMQIKLDRLNCVDISQPADNLPSPPLGHVKTTRFVSPGSSSSSTGPDGHPSSPDINQPSLHSPASPRPHSDFMPRPKDTTFSPHSSSTQSRPNRSLPTQNSSHDSSFDEYYHAKTTFLQNLQSPKGLPAEGVKKNNSDTNLVEIFLVPQDHQPGRFPRMLQNGYIETEACGTAVNVRTGSVRLGRGTGLTSDIRGPNSRTAQPTSAQGEGQRISVYDNFLPIEGKKLEGNETRSVIPGVIQLDSSTDSSSFSRGGVEGNKHELVQEVNSDSNQWDSTDASRDSSVARTIDSQSDQEHIGSSQDRSVTFESLSSSSQTLRESSSSTKEALTGDDSMSSKRSSVDSVSPNSQGVAHSASVDSYFHNGSSSNSEAPSSDSTGKEASSTFQQHYDEFDRILQELYQNINDLTTFMDRDKNASPTSPRSPSESMDFYRGLDNDIENSSSGGEGNTAESGSEDQEATLTDVSHDDSLDQIIEVSMERRDSGVGHSLTRASSDRRHKKIRWHSFQKSHRPDITSRAMQINSLTIGQLVRLQKLSLLRLTGIMEKCLPVNKSGWNWMVPRFMKRHKAPDFSDKNVFGVPLSVMAQRTGQPMPQCILYAMRYLRCTCQSAVGIFRKSGVKSKIQQLRDHLEAHPDTTNFDDENTYNVADMLKTYFRDLPECLLTNKMSETFRSIYTYVPQPQRLEAIQAAILLLPDENREVLQSILLFLSDIADHETDHQMNASNLAVCFTPTVFHLGPRQSLPYSPKRNRKNSTGIPDPREIKEQKAAHECLLMMITDCKKLFTVPHNIFRQLQVQSMAHIEPTLPQDIGNSPSEVRAFGQERIQVVLKESHDKNRGWIPTLTINEVEVFHRKPIDDCPLKEWKMVVDIEAPPIEVLRRIMHERHTWDEDLLSWSVVERLDPYSDIFQFVLNSMAPHPPRNFCILRYWRSDLNKGACSLITMSVQHSDALEIHGVWAMDHGTYFLMEPCGSGRSRLTYITRMDTKGRMPEWYTKIFGHISANFLERLKESFKQEASGPETKV